jgi:hypothetical protein
MDVKTTLLIVACLGQVDDRPPALFHPNFRDKDLFSVMRQSGPGLQQDELGVRITLPSGQGKQKSSGLMTSTAVRGDFEATLAYEILHADQPASGYGVGVSLYAAINPDNNQAVSLARRLMSDGSTKFVSNRMQPVKPRDHVRYLESRADKGMLRLRRVGATMHFLVKEEPAPEFVEVSKAEWSGDDVRLIQVGANAGNSDAGFDIRLVDFTLRAADLPELQPRVAAGPQAAPTDAPPRRSALWIVGAILALALLVTAAAALWRSRARRAGRPARDAQEAGERAAFASRAARSSRS